MPRFFGGRPANRKRGSANEIAIQLELNGAENAASSLCVRVFVCVCVTAAAVVVVETESSLRRFAQEAPVTR